MEVISKVALTKERIEEHGITAKWIIFADLDFC